MAWIIWDRTAGALAGSNPYPSAEAAERHLGGYTDGEGFHAGLASHQDPVHEYDVVQVGD